MRAMLANKRVCFRWLGDIYWNAESSWYNETKAGLLIAGPPLGYHC